VRFSIILGSMVNAILSYINTTVHQINTPKTAKKKKKRDTNDNNTKNDNKRDNNVE
jgi:hypothetical protein